MIDAQAIQAALEGLPVPLMAGWAWFAAAAAVSAYSSIIGARAAAAAQREAAKVSELQGEISVITSEFQAKKALEAGREQADYIRDSSQAAVATRTVRTAASGVELSGSPMMVIADEIWAGEKAAAGALKNAIAQAGQIEARGEADATQANANAAALRTQAGFTESAGWLRAISSAMGAYAYGQQISGGPASTDPSPFRNRYDTVDPYR